MKLQYGAKRSAKTRRKNRPALSRPQSRTKASPIHPMFELQSTLGNQAVQRMLRTGMVQTKPKIGQPGDQYEQQPDRVAEQVMRMPETKSTPGAAAQSRQAPTIQRLCTDCDDEMQRQPMEEEKKEERLQMQTQTGQRPTIKPNFQARITGPLKGGQTLAPSQRAFFEPRFGRDFSHVRVHTDAKAADIAKSINAKALTVGRNNVFGGGEYSPETTEGRKLLVHELMHVVQQPGRGGIRADQSYEQRALSSISQKEETGTSPTLFTGDAVYQNTRKFANCNGVNLQAHTDANYSNSYTAPGSSTPSQGCTDCSEDDKCVTNRGTVISVFNTNPQITLPPVPAGLNECEWRAVQNFINTTLRAHEQQHVAAFNTYRGTVRTRYEYKGCASGLDAHTQQIHDQIEASRKARADNASAALDANGAGIFTVACKCPDPLPDAGVGTTP